METGEKALLCALSRVTVGHPCAARKLLETAGSAEALKEGGPDLVREVLGVPDVGEVLFSEDMTDWGNREAEWYESKGVEVLSILSPSYPKKLLDTPFAPAVLYFRGTAELGDTARKSLSIVGTRMASSYGKECCSAIVSDMARICPDVRIVSGLAIGIDGAAHTAALDCGLETLAVLPCGIDMIYPSSHRSLAVRILSQGGILTEYPRGVKPLRFNFLQRNRIIAGISDALLVAESRISGGSMSTVEYASSYNKDIFAVPGRMTDANSYGCNYLINKNVAQICLNASTIVSSMGWSEARLSDIKAQPDLFSSSDSLKEKLLLSLSSVRGKTMDQLSMESGADVSGLSLALLQLDIEGKARKDSSDRWFKV